MSNLLSLDIGERKIGIARANTVARIAEPLVTLPNNDGFNQALLDIIKQQEVSTIVIGLPRGLNGQETAQTKYVRDFVKRLDISVPTFFQDEAVTSIAARDILDSRGQQYSKEDIDAVAASIILSDYLQEVTSHD